MKRDPHANRAALNAQRVRAGLCVHCGKPNDRAGAKTKNGLDAAACTDCLEEKKRSVERSRKRAQEGRGDIAAALGLTMKQAAALTKRERAKG